MIKRENIIGEKKKWLWNKIVPQIGVEHIKNNKGFYFYFYFFGDLASLKKLPWRFPCAHQLRKLLKKLLWKFFF